MNILEEKMGIKKELIELAAKVELELQDEFKKVEEIAFQNQVKVLHSMQKFGLAEMHFGKSTGYGYDDIGRELIEKVYADIFEAEDALVRIQFVNGTHALSTAMFGVLRPGDNILSLNGRPYDTICGVIGIVPNNSSLDKFGVGYDQIDLKDENFDEEKIVEYLKNNKVKLAIIQRSKGYAWRKSLYIEDIEQIIKKVKEVSPETIVMVDNCYGELVDLREPVVVGADLVVGSLIKNLGGGLAEMGSFIVGKKEYIELCAERLTCPGIGKECGATLGQNKNILQGLFLSPNVVKEAVKTAIFTAKMCEELGYEVMPRYNEKRSDIIQAIKFNDREKLIKFIQGIQSGSPVDNNVRPIPWAMPGYEDEVIMAAGTFVQGASIELSADSPIRPPYVAYMQGGLTYISAKIAVLKALQNIME
ncbi:MAG: methionine gamma-lyase family protein [Clostridia bacterium]